MAAGVGLVVSEVTAIVLTNFGLGAAGVYVPSLIGLAVGVLAGGATTKAHAAGDWLAVGILVVLAQLALGLVLLFFHLLLFRS